MKQLFETGILCKCHLFGPLCHSRILPKLLELKQEFDPMFWNKMHQQDHSGLYRTCKAPWRNNLLLEGIYQASYLQLY